MDVLKRRVYAHQPLWADGFHTGDVFFFHPEGKTYLVLQGQEASVSDPLGQRFVIMPYNTVSEIYFWFYWFGKFKLLPLWFGILRLLKQGGFCAVGIEGVPIGTWTFLRTFTVNRKLRTERLRKLHGMTDAQIYWRNKVREVKDELDLVPH